VIGQKVTAEPDLLRRITAEGHEVGNHTYYHSKLTWINDEKLVDELIKTSLTIYEISGAYDKLFRPPHGTLTKAKIKTITDLGYDIVLWSDNADDFYHTGWGMRTPKSIANRVLGRIKGGDVVLMHDDSPQTSQALPIIISEIKRRGYKFVTVSELVGRPLR
jgi:peptidoglycan/xylan/chitin deacetylase (PgdA/CDA1 family)